MRVHPGSRTPDRGLASVRLVDGADPGEFGRRLRAHRAAASLSQEELAERANLTAKAVGALERGERRRPYPNTVRALCAALDLDEDAARQLAEAVRPRAEEPVAPRTPSSTIPTPPAPLLGRDAELAHVTTLLGLPAIRVVTLTGPGGVGKTRLALEAGEHLRAAGREVVVVDLADIRREDLVLPAIARAFGLQAGSEDLVSSVAELLVDRAPVLVLDNVEHLLGAAAELAALVAHCPGLVVLATSRAPMRIRAEHEIPLGPLSLPGSVSDAAEVAAAPAAQVFADGARRVDPNFTLDASNATAVAEICRRLDGLPLALELAAAHVRYLAPNQLLDRLGHALGSARLRDLPERQQTMQATLDWSNALLTADEQEVLRSLSVFAGGFDLEAAEAVAGAPGRDVLSALEGLIEQSLVVRPHTGAGGPVRPRLLEPVREYALAALSSEEAALVADRHARYFEALAGEARPGLRSTDLPLWLDRLDIEHANLRAALTTLLEQGDLRAAARLGGDTWLYWALRGHAGEGLLWWRRVLDEGGEPGLDEAAQAASHLALAGLHLATGDLEGTRRHAESAAGAARAVGDRAVFAEALVLACMGAAFAGDLSGASTHLEELSGLVGEDEGAWLQAHVLLARAQLALLGGDLEGTTASLDMAEALARSGAGPFTLATALNVRTTVALLVEDDDLALRSATEAAELAADVRTSWTLVYTLSALAALAVRRGRADLAAELYAAGAATAETSLVEVAFRPDLESAEAHLQEVRRRLSDEEFDRCWTRGRTLGMAEVLELLPEISVRPAPS